MKNKNEPKKLTKKAIRQIQAIMDMINQPNLQGVHFKAWRETWLKHIEEIQAGGSF